MCGLGIYPVASQLLSVFALIFVIMYIYAVISFVTLHKFFDVNDGLFCRTLGECVVTVIREGLLDTLGAVRQTMIHNGALPLSYIPTVVLEHSTNVSRHPIDNTGRMQVLESDEEPGLGICSKSILLL